MTNVFYDAADADVWGGVFGDVWVGEVVIPLDVTVCRFLDIEYQDRVLEIPYQDRVIEIRCK